MWPKFSYRGVRSVQLLLLLLLLMVFSSENFGFSPPYAGIAGIGPVETTTFKTPHTNSFEKWYPHKKQRKSVQYLMGKQTGSFERIGFLRYF